MTSIQISRTKLFEQVAAHLERQILGGDLKPGDRLPTERELQTTFGVGRPAIREALITLQRAGLIEIGNGARAKVSIPTASAVFSGMQSAVMQMLTTEEGQHHFQRARLFFECGLARHCASHGTEADLEALGEALKANKAAIGDRDKFVATDIAFHLVLAKAMDNPVFTSLHDAISEWLRLQRTVTLKAPDQEQVAFRAHQAIHDAIARRDPDAAEAAMREHLLQLEGTFWRERQEYPES